MDNTAEAVSARLALGEATVDWCVNCGHKAEGRGKTEAAAQWAALAAEVARRAPFPFLSSFPIERLIARLSAHVPDVTTQSRSARIRRWLHVVSDTQTISGLTALTRRWIERNPHGVRHDLLLTHQRTNDVERRLRAVVEQSGGQVGSVADGGGILARAARVRAAAAEAEVVVLCIHPWDIVAPLAFGLPGGPPVLLLNHQDHAFWAGAGSIDGVIDIRTSGRHLTQHYRGVSSAFELPVPLDDPGIAQVDRSGVKDRLRFGADPSAGALLLTIGRAEKYVRMPGLDFLSAAAQILAGLPDARLVGVGPSADNADWRWLSAESGGRSCAVGEDHDLRPWHAAADLYLEGFPIGSYTALLEAALAGRAVVRKPHLVSPDLLPLDEGALARIPAPVDPADYVRMAVRLASDPGRRRDEAAVNRESVLRYHCGEAWDQKLTELCDALPRDHAPIVDDRVCPLPFELAAYWTSYRMASGAPDAFRFAFMMALKRGLRPRLDGRMHRALCRARDAGVAIVAPTKALVGSWALSILSSRVAALLYGLP